LQTEPWLAPGWNGKTNTSYLVYTQGDANNRCVPPGAGKSKVAIIAGSLAGAAVLAAIIVLVAVFWHRIKEIAQRIFGDVDHSTAAASQVQNNPTYEHHHFQDNVMHQ